MTMRISGKVHCLSKLSFSAMRVVPRNPDTFALTRGVWRDASTSNTWSTGIWLARAIAKIGSRMLASVSDLQVFKCGSMLTGAMKLLKKEKITTTKGPQIHKVRRDGGEAKESPDS